MKAMNGQHMAQLVERLRLYGQAQRLSILSVLSEAPYTVAEIEARTGIGQPALSQQLGELRRAGIIASSRAAREVIYDFASPAERIRTATVLGLLEDRETPSLAPATAEPPRYGAHFASILP
ncbi:MULTISPECIES: ArsR/SmtB family transcription factor [Asaia]|uniref:ArsR/SmtB family transcription factor n=1 Tax=Asaia TaxID=91914 RepID=UPI002554B8C7|nr:metalloregulator ArsR/SmtB family transcription factor [Asaia sp. HumB]MDL2170380.1 metalloregulator ArsR/SmtB family transcription factor [Asaia sp. HumB]